MRHAAADLPRRSPPVAIVFCPLALPVKGNAQLSGFQRVGVIVDVDKGGEEVSATVARSYTINSKILGEDRQVLVSLPGGYEDNQTRHLVLIALDGSPLMGRTITRG